MARIHLTGATGYLGPALVERLRANGHAVEIASYRLPELPATPIDADIVIHLAAAGGGSHHLKRPGEGDATRIDAVNVQGTVALLKALASPRTRMLYFSSNAVYGTAWPPLVATESGPSDPRSDYGRSKAKAESIVRHSRFDYMILRPSGVFGPSPTGRFGSSFLNVLIDRALREGVMDVMGGEQNIDTLFLGDLVEIVVRICDGEWHCRETYNVAGDIVSIRAMMEGLAGVLRRGGHPCVLRSRPWTPTPGVLLNNAKLKRDFLGWCPTRLESSFSTLIKARMLVHSGH